MLGHVPPDSPVWEKDRPGNAPFKPVPKAGPNFYQEGLVMCSKYIGHFLGLKGFYVPRKPTDSSIGAGPLTLFISAGKLCELRRNALAFLLPPCGMLPGAGPQDWACRV